MKQYLVKCERERTAGRLYHTYLNALKNHRHQVLYDPRRKVITDLDRSVYVRFCTTEQYLKNIQFGYYGKFVHEDEFEIILERGELL